MPTDIISFGVLLRASEIEKQIKKLKTPIVLLWPFDADQEASKVETEVAETMNFGSSLDLLAEDIAKLTDYIILDKSDRDYIDNLREAGCHVLFEDLFNYTDEVAQNLISTISSIGKIEVYGNGNGADMKVPENQESDNLENDEEKVKDEDTGDEASTG